MKRLILLGCFLALCTAVSVRAQTLMDYVDEVRGDTLVIKNYTDMGNVANSLLDAIVADEQAPPGRVYLLKAGTNDQPSYYVGDRQFTLPDRPITVVGEYVGQVVQASDRRPPLIGGFLDANNNAVNFALFNTQNNLTLKNVAILPAAPDGSEGWFFTEVTGEDNTIVLENVLGEHNNWTWVQSNNGVGTSIIIRDSYFINATGVATRRNGGVYDSENQPLDSLIVENTTHVQNAGMQYKFRNHPANKVVFNHNTFVNASGQVFLSFGYETNFTVVNNLIVNSNHQAYWPGLDRNESDQDLLPHGIINLNHLPDGIEVADADRKVLVDLNGVWWDPRLEQIVDNLNNAGIEGDVCDDSGCEASGQWMSQMIVANDRTLEIFNDEDRYPRITQGEWIMGGDPNFAELPDMIPALIEWGVNTVRDDNTVLLAKLRRDDNPAEGVNMLRFDWPVAVDLSYTNEAYLTAALGGFPLGDLNWFPEQKAQWEAVKDAQAAQIEAALDAGTTISTAVEPISEEIPSSFELKQNYPNPFNPTTTIRFDLAKNADVTLEVYDIVGRRVATLVNQQLAPGSYSVEWNAMDEAGQRVASGVYFYTLRTSDYVETKQMVLIK